MNRKQCTYGFRHVAIAAVGAIILAFSMGCGEDCPEGQDLIQFDGDEICAAPCDGDDECAEGESCQSNYCIADDDDNGEEPDCEEDEDCNGEYCDDGECVECIDNDHCEGDDECVGNQCQEPDVECDAQQVCEDYCFNKNVRCMEEECDSDTTIGGQPLDEAEYDLCRNGLSVTGPEGEIELIAGCDDQAAASETMCEQLEQEAESYADEECDGFNQELRRCSELAIYFDPDDADTEDYRDACGCTAAKADQECDTDDQCDDYGRGMCLEAADGPDRCTADCYNYGGNPWTAMTPDPSCAEERGLCLQLGELDDQFGDQTMCQQGCSSADDCPSGTGCIPLMGFEDPDTGGIVGQGMCEGGTLLEVDLCEDDDDCDGKCRAGVCYDTECSSDDDCDFAQGEGTHCNDDDGYCDVNFMGADEL